MQFSVPQFIDVEDKIIGPFTLKQFGFIFGGGLIDVGLFKLLGLSIPFFFLAIPIALATLFFSFGSFNGKRIYDVIPIFLRFLSAPKQMVFHHKKKDINDIDIEAINVRVAEEQTAAAQPVIAEEPIASRLKKLSLILDRKNEEEAEALINYRGKNNASR